MVDLVLQFDKKGHDEILIAKKKHVAKVST